MKTARALVRSMRPKQWTKNLLVFAAAIFAMKLTDPVAMARVTATFVLFCLLSGTVYLVNDVVDREQDRMHPRKRKRPIASGELSVAVALGFAALFGPASVAACFLINVNTGLVAAGYLGLTLAYHFLLKSVVILDALAVASGFVLRAVVGAEAIPVEISPWLLLCTLLLALFLSFAKRRQEMVSLEDGAYATRAILQEYSPQLLDQFIAIVTACTVMSYCLYTISERTVHQLGTQYLIFTIPFVIYGIFRYLYLVHQRGQGDAPDQVLLNDLPLLVNLVLYVVAVVLILRYTAQHP